MTVISAYIGIFMRGECPKGECPDTGKFSSSYMARTDQDYAYRYFSCKKAKRQEEKNVPRQRFFFVNSPNNFSILFTMSFICEGQ